MKYKWVKSSSGLLYQYLYTNFVIVLGDRQVETKLRNRKMEGLVLWIDNMYLRIGFNVPGASGSVTRAQILSAGHSPTKAPSVLRVSLAHFINNSISCTCYLLGTGESYDPTAQHTQHFPIFFIQLNYVYK